MNWDVLGHEWAVALLREHVARNQARHAYLLCGPAGVGRRTLALRLAQALNCTQPLAPGEPCRVCRTCQQIERMQHPDLAVVQAEQAGGTLKVDQVRDLQRSLALHPYEARYRFALLLRFEEAHPSAMNALLKTLEEPGPQVILVLTAESPDVLLPTIVSRCEVLRLRPLPLEKLSQALQERRGLSGDQAALLAHLSGGRVGQALHLVDTPALLDQRRIWLDEHARLLSANRIERFLFADGLTKDKDREKERETVRSILQTWGSLWRDVLLCAAGASAPLTNLDRYDEIERLAAHWGLDAAAQMLASLEQIQGLVDANINLRLAIEVLMLDLPYQLAGAFNSPG